MTTNVTISTNHVSSPKKLRVRAVDPKDETKIYREIIVDDAHVKGARDNCSQAVTLETLYVHDGSKLIVEEIE